MTARLARTAEPSSRLNVIPSGTVRYSKHQGSKPGYQPRAGARPRVITGSRQVIAVNGNTGRAVTRARRASTCWPKAWRRVARKASR